MPFPVTTMSDDGGRNFYGFSIDIISALAKAMNFTFSYVLPEDGQWGTHDPKTGAWNGMIGMLMNGNVIYNLATQRRGLHTRRGLHG